jgi:uncharacterized protein YbjT (DUF2867 family)
MAKILVTGATGFIGKRLIVQLLENDHEVWALVRVKGTSLFLKDNSRLHLVWGDLRDPQALSNLPEDLDVAYYLMHSMADIASNLNDMERTVAENFVNAVKKTHIKQIIYLGGIIHGEELSPHLQSRLLVENILKNSQIPTTILRASIIVGSGSASFEIIRDLVEKLPLMVAPRWLLSKCQPIAVRDVLYYLQGVILHPKCLGETFEVGGPDVLTFKDVLQQFAQVRGLTRYIITVPLLTPRLSSYWLVFITSVPFSLASYLVESMKTNTYCLDNRIHSIFSHRCLSYKESIEQAFLKISQNEVISTWMDAWNIQNNDPDIQRYIEVPKHGVLQDVQKVPIQGNPDKVLDNVWKIGGANGWYALDWAWDLRGLMDKFAGGVGMNRGRRHPTEIMVGDSIDFWRVLKADRKDEHLILYAQMKMPGEGWLEFRIDRSQTPPLLEQIATLRPKGLLGRIYWYLLFPFHYLIFRKMATTIASHN